MSNTIGWGKGASNNSIGWGNVGTNGFGSIYTRSNSGETILKDPNFIIEVNTSIAGVSNSDQFQFTGAVGEYDVEAYQNDSLVASFNDLVNEQTITLPSAGIYELRVIPKPAGFDKLTFNNGGDKNKLLKVLQWGLYGVNEPNQDSAFRGCTNNTEIADGGAWFDLVTNGSNMFNSNSLTSLPSGMELPNLSNGANMFRSNFLTSLPSGMELPNLTNGAIMFRDNSLTSLPSGMELPNLTNGRDMFSDNSLTSLPSGMELPNLTNGTRMFLENSLTSLPSGMELPNLTNGRDMFLGNTLNTERYSQLLIDLEEFNANNNVAFHGGNSEYNAQGEIARNLLISRGWTFTDGGAENVFQTATVAYSLRDLGLGATNVVRVRRSSDNLEQDFIATQVTDGSLTTFCGAGDGFVSVWYNQKGVYDATQSNASNQPKIVGAGALILDNGKPAFEFNTQGQILNINDNGGLNSIRQGDFTYASVANLNTRVRSWQSILSLASSPDNGAGALAHQFFANTPNEFGFHYTWIAATKIANVILNNELNKMFAFLSRSGGTDGNGGLVTNYVKDSLGTAFENSGTQSWNSITGTLAHIGKQGPGTNTDTWIGTIQEVIIFPSDKITERPQIETNINNHYAIY